MRKNNNNKKGSVAVNEKSAQKKTPIEFQEQWEKLVKMERGNQMGDRQREVKNKIPRQKRHFDCSSLARSNVHAR